MAVLEFLATATRTQVVTSRHFVLAYRHLALWSGAFARVMTCRCFLSRVGKVVFLFVVTLCALFWSSLLNLILLYLRYLTAHKYANDAVVHLVYHVVEQLDTFQFEYYKRVFLLV